MREPSNDGSDTRKNLRINTNTVRFKGMWVNSWINVWIHF